LKEIALEGVLALKNQRHASRILRHRLMVKRFTWGRLLATVILAVCNEDYILLQA
jgi:hypothetical protein